MNFLGAIIGDICGRPYEFNNVKSDNFDLITENSTFTDDTVLTIACMDALCHANSFSSREISRYLRKWSKKYPWAGYGNSFYEWIYDKDAKAYNSYGNGAAMRVSAAAYLAVGEKSCAYFAKVLTRPTHNHPEGMKGAEVVARCIYKALKGKTKEEIKDYVRREYPIIDTLDFEELKRSYEFNETCQNTVPQAIYCFLISKDFEDCLRKSIRIGGDSDTLAAISCSIAEAYYDEIPQYLVDYVKSKLPQEMLEIIDDITWHVNLGPAINEDEDK